MTNHRTNNVAEGVYENLSIHVIGRISYGLLEYASEFVHTKVNLGYLGTEFTNIP